jgi:GMP synthase (glutamine-hydrolysing)
VAAAALVLEHDRDAPAALLIAWAQERGVALEIVASGAPIPDPEGRPFVVSLGAEGAAYDTTLPWIAAERTVLDRAIARDVPVLGICFGAQHLALALGGSVAPASRPEVGWLEIETSAPDLVPEGPWLQWHRDGFTVPPGAETLAVSAVGAQAFALGPHLGVQFHPEVTPAIALGWARDYPSSMAAAGTTLAAVRAGGERWGDDARARAFRLFDGFLARAQSARRLTPDVVG